MSDLDKNIILQEEIYEVIEFIDPDKKVGILEGRVYLASKISKLVSGFTDKTYEDIAIIKRGSKYILSVKRRK